MTGPQTLRGAAIRRASACLVMLVAALVVAPVAAATPEGDADAAITSAWQAAGGATGPLGAKDGGVYAAGPGFGQNLAGGRIYYTPDTGAHVMQGAILDKYLALGGPADGDLGFPNIDEGAGKAPGSRNTTFSAADRPVIFWTPENGAHVVRGAINAAWDKLGGSGGTLGVPVDDETYDGDVVSQAFANGRVSWDHRTKVFTTTPPELVDQLAGLEIPGDVTTAINAARRAAGGPLGPLGAPDGGQYKVGADGVGQNFAGGKIFYSPATGASVVTGQILAKYESLGGPDGDLGLPTASEADGGLDRSRVATFAAADQPVIFWTPDYGAVVVRGAMNAAWAKLGGATGQLGAPTSDQVQNGDVITQTFAGGAVSWDAATKKFSTEPPSLASTLSDLEVPGADLPKNPAKGQASPAADGNAKWYTWHKSYLVYAIAAAAVLLVAIAAAVFLAARSRRRRRSAQPDHYDDYENYPGDDDYDEDQAYSDDRAYRDDRAYESGPIPQAYESGPIPRAFESGPLPRAYESGPIPVATHDDYGPVSAWATPIVTGRDDNGLGPASKATIDAPPSAPPPPPPPPPPKPPVSRPFNAFAENEDVVDTAPTYVESDSEIDENWAPPSIHPSGPSSGRHAAIQLDEPGPALTSLRLAQEDPYDAPSGYPIKADTKTGLYWTPDSSRYGVACAEIWFASEEFALTNGFTKG